MSRYALFSGSLLLLLAVLAGAGAARADDWTQLAGGAARRGSTSERTAPGTGAAWSAPGGGVTRAGPVCQDGVVVTVDEQGLARGLDEATGALRWTRALGGRDLTSTPAAGRGRVVLCTGGGDVVCLAVGTGQVLWQVACGGGPRASVALEDDVVVINQGFPSRKLRALDLLTGAQRWERDLGQIGYSSPAVAEGVVCLGTTDGRYEARALSDGAQRWSYPTSGTALLTPPALVLGQAFLLPGGADARLHRVALDPAQWGGNWTLTLADPVPPTPSWSLMGVLRSTATPVWTGQYVVCVVRFDYTQDKAAPWWVPDTYTSRERIYVIDPAGPSVRWQADVASQVAATQQSVPPFGHCPAPVVISDGTTTWIGVASSLGASFRWYRASDGAAAGNFALAGERWGSAASPAAGNARLALATESGRVEVRALGANTAPAAPVNGIAAGAVFDELARPTLSWSAALDAEDAAGTISHEVRVDSDGEVLLGWEQGALLAAGVTSWQVPAALRSDAVYTFSVRARDPAGAWSPWSTPTTLQVALTPEAPRNLRAEAEPTALVLRWDPSPSAWVQTYVCAWRRVGDAAFGAPVAVGPVTAYRVEGLEQGARYELKVWARSSLGKESAAVSVTAAPEPAVTVNGVPFPDLVHALAAVRAGGYVHLAAGTFRASQTLSLPRGATLRGAGPHLTRIVGDPLFPAFRIARSAGVAPGARVGTVAPGATAPGQEEPALLRDLSIHGARVGVEVEGEAALERVLIYDVEDGATVAAGGALRGNNVTITRATRHGLLVASGGSLTLQDSILSGNEVGLEVEGTPAAFSTRYCAIKGNVVDRKGCSPDPTDLAVLPLFKSVDLRDFRVESKSPTVDAGDPETVVLEEPSPHGGRANLGAFGTTAAAATSPEALAAAPVAGSGGGGGGCALGTGETPGAPAWLLLALLLPLAGRRSADPSTQPTRVRSGS
ncbi:MAG: PQQ-binding-like beta-propeller repeat protein [Planctomycetota bacterium]